VLPHVHNMLSFLTTVVAFTYIVHFSYAKLVTYCARYQLKLTVAVTQKCDYNRTRVNTNSIFIHMKDKLQFECITKTMIDAEPVLAAP
jgi:hypothetical protein